MSAAGYQDESPAAKRLRTEYDADWPGWGSGGAETWASSANSPGTTHNASSASSRVITIGKGAGVIRITPSAGSSGKPANDDWSSSGVKSAGKADGGDWSGKGSFWGSSDGKGAGQSDFMWGGAVEQQWGGKGSNGGSSAASGKGGEAKSLGGGGKGTIVVPVVRFVIIPGTKQSDLLGDSDQVLQQIQWESSTTVTCSVMEGVPHVIVKIVGGGDAVEYAEAMLNAQWDQVVQSGFAAADQQWGAQTVDLPQEMVGEIIGMGGQNLRDMTKYSQCQIKFQAAASFDPRAPAGKQVCVLTGPEPSLHIAERLIFGKITDLYRARASKKGQITATQQAASSKGPKIPCKFHMKVPGSCRMGEGCVFSHDTTVIANYKTTICRHWELGTCPHSDKCLFAHGADELGGGLRKPVQCRNWEQGFCAHGNRCFFAHDEPAPMVASMTPAPPEPADLMPWLPRQPEPPPEPEPEQQPSMDISMLAKLAERQLRGM